MSFYAANFDANDLYRELRQLIDLSKNNKRIFYGKLHNLTTDIAQSIQHSSLIKEYIDDYELLTNEQIGYFYTATLSGESILRSLNGFFDQDNDVFSKDGSNELKQISEDLVTSFCTLSEVLPKCEDAITQDNIPIDNPFLLNTFVNSYKFAFYTFNRYFANQIKPDTYNPIKDLDMFIHSMLRQEISEKIRLIAKPQIKSIETKVDYFENVLLPLIKNIQQHACNHDNDIYDRLTNPLVGNHQETITMSIQDSVDNSKLDFNNNPLEFSIHDCIDEINKEIIITVEDFGFGIRPEIQSQIFQKRVSTKKDNLITHGVGLETTKAFVEENGGRIWFETEIGKGTSFMFTIHYKEKVLGTYRQ